VTAEQSASSPEEFLTSLALVATMGTVDAATLPRVAQLLAKTNQFNLTTRRHSAAEIQTMIDTGAVALWLRLADRFGDHGLVGVALAVPKTPASWHVDTFLLSCRVIGRGAETALLARVTELARKQGATELIGEFVPTAKNGFVSEFYPQHGFAPIAERQWRLDLTSSDVKYPPFITLETA
jgi:FkbH-like protein